MVEITKSTVLSPVWQTSHTLPDVDRLALFDPERSELVMLNPVGREVWQRLDGTLTVAQLVAQLRDDAEGAPDQDGAESEVLHFLRDLLSRGAVEVASPAPE